MNTFKLLLMVLTILGPAPVPADLAEHGDLVVANGLGRPGKEEVRVTYLGTNGYLFESLDGTVLVDPYATRLNVLATAFNARVAPDPQRVDWLLRRLPPRIDLLLVTHGHIDHLLDAAPVAQATGAKIVASRSSVLLAQATGAGHVRAVGPGEVVSSGRIKVRVLAASHDRILGLVPFAGCRHQSGPAPQRVADWVCGQPLAFLIELGGQRIYVDSGGTRAVLPPRTRVDLAILGVALPDSRRRFDPAVRRLNPRYVLPSHQDDFFRPLERGFRFGLLTDFPAVRRSSANLPSRLILLDYLRPWTLR